MEKEIQRMVAQWLVKAVVNEELALSQVSKVIESFKPIVYGLLKEAIGIYEDYVDNKEFHQLRAKNVRVKFEALVEAGFTEDQALSLLISERYRNASLMSQTKSATNAAISADLATN